MRVLSLSLASHLTKPWVLACTEQFPAVPPWLTLRAVSGQEPLILQPLSCIKSLTPSLHNEHGGAEVLVSHRLWGPVSSLVVSPQVSDALGGPAAPTHPARKSRSQPVCPSTQGGFLAAAPRSCSPADSKDSRLLSSISRNPWGDQQWVSVFFSNAPAMFTHFTSPKKPQRFAWNGVNRPRLLCQGNLHPSLVLPVPRGSA